MAIRFYLLPVQVVMVGDQKYRGPAYLKWRMNPTGLDVPWSLKDYGTIDLGSVAVDGTAENHAYLAAQANVYQFPANLDVTMTSAQRSTLSAYLEARAVPGTWIAARDTFRTALRTVTAMFLFMQRLTHTAGGTSPLDWGVALNTQWRNLSAQQREWISSAFVSLEYSTASIGNTSTMRAIIKDASEQFGSREILFGFVTL